MSASLDYLSIIRQPPTPATAERVSGGDMIIHWTADSPVAAVYLGHTPDTIDRTTPLSVTATAEHELRVGNVDTDQRPYFELQFADGRTVLVAERILQLQGGVNFRDIGGYHTRDGRTVRWGQVYRSGSLNGLTADDLAYLEALGIRLDCDLRTTAEVAERPDQLPDGATFLHLEVGGHVSRVRRTVTLFYKRNRLREVLQEAYTRVMIDQNGAVFGDLFRALADPQQLPMIVHCTAGKDRTGVAIAILLSALGVDDETIAADYSLSNYYHDIFAGQMAGDMRRLFSLGFSEAQLQAFMLAEPETMLGVLAYVRDRYGSVADYLSLMGNITPDELQRVRDNLLT